MNKFYTYTIGGEEKAHMLWEAVADHMGFKRTYIMPAILEANVGNVDLEERYSDDEWTPLLMTTAYQFADMELVRMLVEAGANVNAQDAQGNTPLHNAAYFGNQTLVKYLIANGADKKIQNKKGQYPKDVANQYKKEMV